MAASTPGDLDARRLAEVAMTDLGMDTFSRLIEEADPVRGERAYEHGAEEGLRGEPLGTRPDEINDAKSAWNNFRLHDPLPDEEALELDPLNRGLTHRLNLKAHTGQAFFCPEALQASQPPHAPQAFPSSPSLVPQASQASQSQSTRAAIEEHGLRERARNRVPKVHSVKTGKGKLNLPVSTRVRRPVTGVIDNDPDASVPATHPLAPTSGQLKRQASVKTMSANKRPRGGSQETHVAGALATDSTEFMKIAASKLGSGLYPGRSAAGASNATNGLSASRYASDSSPIAAANTANATWGRARAASQSIPTFTPPAQSGLGGSRYAMQPPPTPILSKVTPAPVPSSPPTSPGPLSPTSGPEWSAPPTPLAAVPNGRGSGGDEVVIVNSSEVTTALDSARPELLRGEVSPRRSVYSIDYIAAITLAKPTIRFDM